MKRKIIIFCFVFVLTVTSICVFANTNNKIETSVYLISDIESEIDFIKNFDELSNNSLYLKEEKIQKGMFKKVNKEVKLNGASTSNELDSINTYCYADTIAVNYDLINDEKVLLIAKQQLASGANIIYYGNNIDKEKFIAEFELYDYISDENELPKNENNQAEANATDRTTFIGVENRSYGNVLITGVDKEYDFYRTISAIVSDAYHSKKLKLDKPYNKVEKSNVDTRGDFLSSITDFFFTKAYAADVSDFPTVNSQRKHAYYNYNGGANRWHLITDYDLHRDGQYSDDPTYDYFILQTTNTLDCYYSNYYETASKHYVQLQPYYSNDTVRAGGPSNQSGTTSIEVAVYPPSIGFTYTPSSSNVSVSDALTSIVSNYVTATYNAAGFYGFFDTESIHQTLLSFRNYSPSEAYTYVKVKHYSKTKDYTSYEWHWAHNYDEYYWDYSH